ncbi:MAG TPA: TRAM domain-containing protein, partial [Fimbriimonas sp.]|nr:TRAM domain-containing protein [Fimbriimonas sp.]
ICMRRPWDGERYLKLFDKVRAAMPDVAIRTTFIVGFPGETKAEFDYLLDFVGEAKLDRVGAFLYSREPGTPSHDFDGQVPIRTKQTRFDQLMTLQQGISQAKNDSWIDRELLTLVEDSREGWLIGRSHRDAPDIDGMVIFKGVAKPGDMVSVKITEAEPYDVFGVQADSGIAVKKRLEPLRMAPPKAPQ